MLGGFWLVCRTARANLTGMNMENVLTLGYDPEKKKYIGQWVDSMMPHAWKYEGEVDASGKQDHDAHFRPESPRSLADVQVHRDLRIPLARPPRVHVLVLEEDGKWTQMVTFTSKRKK